MALNVASNSLRSWLQSGGRAGLAHWITWLAPLCHRLAERHGRGELLYVHPSSLVLEANALTLRDDQQAAPTLPADRATLAPELRDSLAPGDAKGSVFAIAAMLVEGLAHEPYDPSAPPPHDRNPSLPDALRPLLARALVADRAERPADLHALADALAALPVRDPSLLDIEIDVSVSMLPPKPVEHVPAIQVIAPRKVPPPPASSHRATEELVALKAKLETNRAALYVVIKDNMDHGPFTSVELLRQIATRAFLGSDILRDSATGRSAPISEFKDFAPFVEQSSLGAQVQLERAAIASAAKSEARHGATKLAVSGGLVLATVGAIIFVVVREQGLARQNVTVASDRAGSIEVTGMGSAKRNQKRRPAGPGGGGGAGGGPGSNGGGPSGGSFESVLDNNNEEMVMGAAQTPDLTKEQLAGPMRSVSFISACGAPDNMKVTVRVAVKNGRAAGVTVSTNPPNAGVAGCIDSRVRGLAWPVSPKADFVTMSY
jgi:hypothetical protein